MIAHNFIPCTRDIVIDRGVRYRPVRSWHSGVLAGERLRTERGDSSGCVREDSRGSLVTSPPYTVTHRLYWHPANPNEYVSAFLSYPNGMGCCDQYFWENNIGDCERFTGETAEEDCEASIVAHLTKDL